MKELNANRLIKVRLTEEGIEILRRHHDELYSHFRKEIRDSRPFQYPEMDEEGYTQFQLWDFMRIFGSHLSPGAIPPFDANIRIEDEDLVEVPKKGAQGL